MIPPIEVRPMPAASLTRAMIEGPAGAIETDINDPGAARRAIALVAHPNPQHGGTKDNKVVTTLAKTFFALGCAVARPNFRGTGASEGRYDEGRGESEDLIAVARHLRARYGALPLLAAGFSFGAYVQARAAGRLEPARLVLVGPAVNRFHAEPVPPGTLVIHGERDEVVPLAAVLDWARPQQLPVVVLPGCGHFFHGRLGQLSEIVLRHLASGW
ncbi:MAG TPA: alpha/beta hydrolase [Burkholderiales bacterium]|nr:alpha/beta hydrolase [Burkholderiales bacterium]